MGGRGRGRGQSSTFTRDQLGIQKADLQAFQTIHPPPLYPSMEYKPLPLSSGLTQERLVAAKRSMRTAFRESPFFVKADSRTSWVTDVLNNSGRNKESQKKKGDDGGVNEAMSPDYCWSLFPKELVPASNGGLANVKKRKTGGSSKNKKPKGKMAKTADVLEKLDMLEKSDTVADDAEEDNVRRGDVDSDDDEEEGDAAKKQQVLNEDEEPVEDEDEEMDEGTDYANNYFDGGEDYVDDADDDVDEGPVF